jgi:chorismate dehydratase
MTEWSSEKLGPQAIRIGAVAYLNSRPLVVDLVDLLPTAQMTIDLPSRLADGLAAGKLDVALVPSIEYFRHPGYRVISDACVACNGPVKSVKLFGRRPLDKIRTLALDEGSRSSSAMVSILLRDQYGLEPKLESLPIGASIEDCSADAVMLIGDRAMQASGRHYQFVWDLGQWWSEWTGWPFVFAMWVARPGIRLNGLDQALSIARDRGITRIPEIAQRESLKLGLDFDDCLTYLSQNLRYRLESPERHGLETFRRLAVSHGFIPDGVHLVFHNPDAA